MYAWNEVLLGLGTIEECDNLDALRDRLLTRLELEGSARAGIVGYSSYEIVELDLGSGSASRVVRTVTVPFSGEDVDKQRFTGTCEIAVLSGDQLDVAHSFYTPKSSDPATSASNLLTWDQWITCMRELTAYFIVNGCTGAVVCFEQGGLVRETIGPYDFTRGIPRIVLQFGDFDSEQVQRILDKRGLWNWRYYRPTRHCFGVLPTATSVPVSPAGVPDAGSKAPAISILAPIDLG